MIITGGKPMHLNNNTMALVTPFSLKAEHDELHQKLKKLIFLPGKTGEMAHVVAHLLHPHFEKEEKEVAPYLGLLPMLSEDKIPDDAGAVMAHLDQLKKELPQMLEAHHQITAAVQNLRKVAREEQRFGAADFADKLLLHTRTEEDIIYPTLVLMGNFLKLKQLQEPARFAFYL